MSLSNTLETAIAALLFNGTAIANLADNAGSSPATVLYFALHSSDPGEAGNQSTNEVSYGGYARVAVNRNSGGLVVSGPLTENVGAVTFPKATSGTVTATHISLGLGASGATVMIGSGALTSSLAISINVQPTFPAGDIDITFD